jgi:rhamnulokinase
MYLKLKEPDVLAKTKKMLMIPDLFAYMLTGEMHEEATIASTSNLYDGRIKNWSFPLIEKLGLPKEIFADIIEPGSVYGTLSHGGLPGEKRFPKFHWK